MLDGSPVGVKVIGVVQSCPMIDINNQSSNFDVLLCEEAHID